MLRSLGHALLCTVLLGLLVPGLAAAQTSDDTELGPIFLMSLGGKLYDNLWAVIDQPPPGGRNPALQGADAIADEDTWRCVTCHGWDYSGADIQGTRFPGLNGLQRADAAGIRRTLTDPTHPFPADSLSDITLDILTLFLVAGRYDRAALVDSAGSALGNPEFGRDIFEGACISCHQLDGRAYLRGERGMVTTLGAVARETPERALHRIMNGVPAAEMLSLRFLSEAQIADLLAYLQTLEPDAQ